MANSDPQDPSAGKAADGLPLSGYKVVESERVSSEEKVAETQQPAQAAKSAPAGVESAASDLPVPKTPLLAVWMERIQRFAENRTRVYAAVGVGLGIFFGIAVAAFSGLFSSSNGRYDLGPVTVNASGLTGHLFAKWDKKLSYRLTLEPSDPNQLAGFSYAAGNSPRPLSVEIQLEDAQGFVLCSNTVLLKFDPRKTAAFAVSNSGQMSADNASGGQFANGADFARQDAEEAARERGKDVFKSQTGPDGQIASLSVQGNLPCSRNAYESAVSWSMIPDFPTVAQQDEMLRRPEDKAAGAATPPSLRSGARSRRTAKPAPNTSLFFIEGDDQIIDFDASAGVITTRTGRTFLIDKSGAEANTLQGRDLPLRIHYRCDQTAACMIACAGAGVLHSRLRK